MHSTTIVFGLATASLAFAQSSTISLFIPGADTQSLIASVVGSDATATTYAFQCAPGRDSSDCGFPEVVTLTEGPAIAALTFAPQVDTDGTTAFAGYVDCSLAQSSAVCTISNGGTAANDPGMSTATLSGTDYTYMPVVITALASNTGSGNVLASTTISSGSSSATVSKSSESGTKTSTSASASQTSSGTGTAAQNTSSSKTGTSTNAAGGAAITGHAAWVFGGAALAMAAMA